MNRLGFFERESPSLRLAMNIRLHWI